MGSIRWFKNHLWVAKRETYNEYYADVISFTNTLDDTIVFQENASTYCWEYLPEISSVCRLGDPLASELEEWIDQHIDELTQDDFPAGTVVL